MATPCNGSCPAHCRRSSADDLSTLLRASIERNDARALLREIHEALNVAGQCWFDGEALRVKFNARIEALIAPSAPGLLTLAARDVAPHEHDDGDEDSCAACVKAVRL